MAEQVHQLQWDLVSVGGSPAKKQVASWRARKAMGRMRRSDGAARGCLCRRAAESIKKVHPGIAPHILRAMGAVSVQRKKLLRIRGPSRNEALLEFIERPFTSTAVAADPLAQSSSPHAMAAGALRSACGALEHCCMGRGECEGAKPAAFSDGMAWST